MANKSKLKYRRSSPPEKRGRVKKTFEILLPTITRAEEILSQEARPRSMTRLIEDLLDAEHSKMFGGKGIDYTEALTGKAKTKKEQAAA